MGRKIRAAKASLVAAFLAAGGAAAAKAVPAATTPGSLTISGSTWGDDPVTRFLKLDGFPAYLKIDGFASLTQYYKDALMGDGSTLYLKYEDQVSGLLDLYQKADGGPLGGLLAALEQYYKHQDSGPLLDYLKTEAGMDAYLKFEDFFGALETVARADEGGSTALEYFQKLTGIAGLPAVQDQGPGPIG
jgi:hypothetical protein